MPIINEINATNQIKTGWPWTEETSPDIYDKSVNWPKISIVTPSFNQGQFIDMDNRFFQSNFSLK